MPLMFKGTICIGRIFGDAIPTDTGITVVDETLETESVEDHRIFLVDGVITIIPYTIQEITTKEELMFNKEIFSKIGKAIFNHENRIRTLEGKASITKDQFISAIKSL